MATTHQQTVSSRVYSSGIPERVIAQSREHHLVIDGPDYAGGPGEALMPVEVFLSGIGGCAVAMFDRIARAESILLKYSALDISGTWTRHAPNANGFTLFERVTLKFVFAGVTEAQGAHLIEVFKANCPLYGSIAASAGEVQVEYAVET